MYLKEYNSKLGIEISGHLANLQIGKTGKTGKIKKTDFCFVSGDFDCLTIGDIIKAAGYAPASLLDHGILITIENKI